MERVEPTSESMLWFAAAVPVVVTSVWAFGSALRWIVARLRMRGTRPTSMPSLRLGLTRAQYALLFGGAIALITYLLFPPWALYAPAYPQASIGRWWSHPAPKYLGLHRFAWIGSGPDPVGVPAGQFAGIDGLVWRYGLFAILVSIPTGLVLLRPRSRRSSGATTSE